ncbi:phage portal protein [Clostridium tetani]|uniref:Phage portal protein n=1 Tax=Clostridium tetani TaxID=1513 RepID=A0ABY0EQ24_CLOTA|nr:phage portal protein [Clostridium tetani]KHO36830.1 nucleoid-structuring protein H-NS [Clostridium tetani]RXI56943.1 phage portal protein [Clostridium tetani]RXI57653.1 phage portal protein [Clostridium tetani]RXI65339.1 phage portal protein [Clostridium tetani]
MLFRRNMINKTEEISINDKELLKWLGINVEDIDIQGKNSLKQATVFGCIRVLSDTVSKLPIKIYQNKDGIKKVADHYLGSLLKLRPNPYMSASDFWKCVEVQRNIYGNAYVALDFNNRGQVTGLSPLDSSKMQIFVDDVGLLNSSNKIWYIYTDNLGHKIKFKSDELLHFKGLTTDGIVGLSVIDQLKHLIQNGKSSEEYINKFFKNGLQVKGLVQYVGDLNHEAEETFIKEFERMSSGLKNAHRIAMLPLGYQFQPISQKLVDAQFLENSQLTIRQIAAMFGVKMHQLNDLDRATHTNIAEQQRGFYIDTLQSILTMYEQELAYKLFLITEIRKGYYIKFNVDAILRADIKTRYESYRIGIQGGFITANEVRQLEEKEALPGGDKLLINGNMMPIEMAGEQYKKGGDK